MLYYTRAQCCITERGAGRLNLKSSSLIGQLVSALPLVHWSDSWLLSQRGPCCCLVHSPLLSGLILPFSLGMPLSESTALVQEREGEAVNTFLLNRASRFPGRSLLVDRDLKCNAFWFCKKRRNGAKYLICCNKNHRWLLLLLFR